MLFIEYRMEILQFSNKWNEINIPKTFLLGYTKYGRVLMKILLLDAQHYRPSSMNMVWKLHINIISASLCCVRNCLSCSSRHLVHDLQDKRAAFGASKTLSAQNACSLLLLWLLLIMGIPYNILLSEFFPRFIMLCIAKFSKDSKVVILSLFGETVE